MQRVYPMLMLLLGLALVAFSLLGLAPDRRAAVPTTPAEAPAWLPGWADDDPRWLQLDADLPDDHRARQLEQALQRLDLQPLYQSYRGRGSPPHHPRRLLLAVLWQLQRGIQSPATWARDAREALPVRWLLRGACPDRSRGYAFRQRLAPFLDAWQQQLLQQAQTQGQTHACQGALDGTLVAALGSRHQLCNATRLHKRLAALAQVIATETGDARPTAAADLPVPRTDAAAGGTPTLAAVAPAAAERSAAPAGAGSALGPHGPTGAATPPPEPVPAPLPAAPASADVVVGVAPPPARPAWMARTPQGRRCQAERYQEAAQQLQQRLAANAQRPASKRLAAQRVVVCPAEPEAALGLDKQRVFRPLYTASLVADLESPLVLAWDVFAQSNDSGTLIPMMQRTQTLTGRALQKLLADGTFARHRPVAAAEAAGVVLYAPWVVSERRTRPDVLDKAAFVWQADSQTYRCPQGQVLTYAGTHHERQADGERLRVHSYRGAAATCQACVQRATCTTDARGRKITRSEHEEAVERLKARMASAEGQAAYAQRKETVELRFADQKEHRSLRRLTSRGLCGARTQVGLNVLVHNLFTVADYAQKQEQGPRRLSLDVVDP